MDTTHIIKGRCRVLYGIVVNCFCLFPHHEGSTAAATRPSCTEDSLTSSGIIPGKSGCDQSCHKIQPCKTCYGGKNWFVWCVALSAQRPPLSLWDWTHIKGSCCRNILFGTPLWSMTTKQRIFCTDCPAWGFYLLAASETGIFPKRDSIPWPFVSHTRRRKRLCPCRCLRAAFWWLPRSASCLSFATCSDELPCFPASVCLRRVIQMCEGAECWTSATWATPWEMLKRMWRLACEGFVSSDETSHLELFSCYDAGEEPAELWNLMFTNAAQSGEWCKILQ